MSRLTICFLHMIASFFTKPTQLNGAICFIFLANMRLKLHCSLVETHHSKSNRISLSLQVLEPKVLLKNMWVCLLLLGEIKPNVSNL